MDILHSIYLYSIPFLLILTVLVFVHELGHYLAARWNGVRVEVFSIGFGPEIFGWTDKNQTRWKISLFPLGGYVKMFSDANAASQPDAEKIQKMTQEEKQFSLVHKTVWQRIQVSFAGPFANYILAFGVFALLFMVHGQQKPSEEAKIGVVLPHSTAEEAGLKTNDTVIEVNGNPVKTFLDLYTIVRNNPQKELEVIFLRDQERKILTLVPQVKDTKDAQGNHIKVGILGVMQGTDLVKHSFIGSLWHAANYTVSITVQTLQGIGQMLLGKKSTEGLSGPLGIAQMTAEIAKTNWENILFFMAFLSLNLGLINLFPIPMLDGGHLLFYFIEALRGKPVSEKAQENAFRVGLVVILCLFLLSTWNDVTRLQWLKQLLK